MLAFCVSQKDIAETKVGENEIGTKFLFQLMKPGK
jgi:hypothetical protein